MVSDLHLSHFQHHAGTRLTLASGIGLHLKWATEKVQIVSSEHQVLSSDGSDFGYF